MKINKGTVVGSVGACDPVVAVVVTSPLVPVVLDGLGDLNVVLVHLLLQLRHLQVDFLQAHLDDLRHLLREVDFLLREALNLRKVLLYLVDGLLIRDLLLPGFSFPCLQEPHILLCQLAIGLLELYM